MKKLTFLSAVSDSALANARPLSAFIVAVALGLAFAGAPLAQTTSKVDVRNYEVIAVDGNTLVVRDERGTNELTVPADFRFTVDGKKMSVSELKPGMKGTATVTTTTTVKPVFVTEVKEGVVLKVGSGLVDIRDAQRVRRRFTQDQLDARGVEIFKDGKPMRISQLKEGDMLTATFVTKAEPVVVTETDVQATTAPGAEPKAEAKAEAKAEPKAESAPMQVAKADAPPAATPPSAAPPPPAVQPAPPPSESSGLGTMWWVLIIVVLAVVVFAMMRRRKQT
jgi:hypothetical protein